MWLKNNWFKVSILALLSLSIGLSVYYFFFFRPTLQNIKPLLSPPEEESATQKTETEAAKENTKQVNKTTGVAQSITSVVGSDSLSQTTLNAVMSRIVLITCKGNGIEARGSGTAGLIKSGDQTVVTNFHVVGAAGGNIAYCTINMPEEPDYSPGAAFLAQLGKFDGNYPNVDVAVLHINDVPSKYSPAFESIGLPFCDGATVKISDKITLFGYPAFGGTTLTVTDGIISGFINNKFGKIYKTSAKVDHGISGGLAIRNKDKCILGIPTWAQYGSSISEFVGGNNLGQIQSWDSIKNSGEIF